MSGIYALTVDGLIVYIGKTHDLDARMKQHYSHIFSHWEQSEKKYWLLQNAAMFHEIDFMVLTDCAPDDLSEQEAWYINFYKPPLNAHYPRHPDFPKQESPLKHIDCVSDMMVYVLTTDYQQPNERNT